MHFQKLFAGKVSIEIYKTKICVRKLYCSSGNEHEASTADLHFHTPCF